MRIFSFVLLLGTLTITPAAAQERPLPMVQFATGAFLFPDDGPALVRENFVGGSAHVYLSPRVSVGPELAFVTGQNHSHTILTGNVMLDLAAPRAGRPRLITPFVVAGGGLYRTTEEFPGMSNFSHSEGAFTAGGGVRALIGDYVTVGVDARAGWELHTRVNATVGIRLGR